MDTPGETLRQLGLYNQFGTILADPPWRFMNRTGKMAPEHRRLLCVPGRCVTPFRGPA